MKTTGLFLIALIAVSLLSLQAQHPGTRIVTEYGYENCLELYNATTRVVLEPNRGGRVLIYELNGNNILWIDPKNESRSDTQGRNSGSLDAGRIDIGPEMTAPRHRVLWSGKWEGQITGPRTATLTSQKDSATGVQLIRTFALDENSSHLSCTQVIRNVSKETKRYFFWARTFVEGGGISLTPLNPQSRYPRGYIIYGPGRVMDYMPAEEENLRVREGVLEILGPPSRPKFVMDCSEGWLAYLALDNQLFIKRFPVYEDRVYGDMAGNTVSIWYNRDIQCEIEPMGPMEIIEPGGEASFTEHWYLFDYTYPEDRNPDLQDIKARVIACEFNAGPDEGWISLFNGRDLNGWIVECEPQDKGKNYWSVQDGMIVVNSMGDKDHDYVWLASENEYEDFQLKMKFAAFKDSPGNSGVQIRSRYDHDTSYLDGPQLDIHPTGPWRTGMIYDETRGYRRWIFPDIPLGDWVNEEMVTQDFEFLYSTDENIRWNEFEISARGWKIESWLNGVKMTDFDGSRILDDSIHRRYNTGKRGVIALQLHTGDELKMYYKDIHIRE